MSGGKETPRQKMIGMMYLFYTALLALNISSDILNAFVLVNESMVQTNGNFGSKNELLMNAFENQYRMNEAKVKPYYDKAIEAKKTSDELVTYLHSVLNKLVIQTEFGGSPTENFEYRFRGVDGKDSVIVYKEAREIPARLIKAKDKYNVPMEVLISEVPGAVREADVMKTKFKAYNDRMLSLLSEEDRKDIKPGLNTSDVYDATEGKWQTWEHNSFHHTVLVADLVLINKYVSEVLNTESEVLAKLYSYIDAKTIKFDEVEAKVIPKSTVVISGTNYEADIFVAAYSKTETPEVNIKNNVESLSLSDAQKGVAGITKIDSANNGMSKYSVKTGTPGEYKYAGFINVKQADGSFKQYPFNSTYQVIKPTATVAADKVNVVYRMIKNPLSVSVPGFTNEKVKLILSGDGTLTSTGNGHYDFTPTAQSRDISFTVIATKDDGSTVNMGSFPFRSLPVPPPTIRLAGNSEGEISKAVLATNPFLVANLDNFLFELKYRVTSFEIMVTSTKGMIVTRKVSGTRLPDDVVNSIKKAPNGSIIIISSVQTTGDDGAKRAPGITLKLN